MIARALTQRWEIKPEYRDALIRRLIKIIADPSSSPREVTAASKALIAAEAQNQADDRINQAVDERITLSAIAERLNSRIVPGRLVDGSEGGSSGTVDGGSDSTSDQGRTDDPAGADGPQASG